MMRLPWVSREVLDTERAATERLIAHFQRENDRLAGIADALRTELSAVTLRVTTPPVAPPAPDYTIAPRPADPDGDLIRAAIRDESGGDPRLAAYLRSRASELARSGDKTARQIADELRTWETVGDPFDPARYTTDGVS